MVNEGSDNSHNQQKHMSWYVVAFLDLLGQQDALRKLKALPDRNNEEEVRVFREQVQNFYKPLYGMKTFFKDSISRFIDGDPNEASLPQQMQELLREFRSTPINYRYFSDSLIINIPLRNDVGKFQSRAIYAVLAATSVTFLSCLANSWSIRGGIDVGLAINIEENEIYGPALARAYGLESKVAQYPRIVIGEELIRYLQAVAAKPAQTNEEIANCSLAQKALGMLAIDDDGCTFLDWLGNDIRESFKNRSEPVKKAFEYVIQESIKHKESKNSKLGFRYTLLRNYMESRLPNWGFRFEDE